MTAGTQVVAPCAISPRDKKLQAKQVGDDLVKHYGKRKFYSTWQVKAANQRCEIPLDFSCWSFALFNSHEDFDQMHAAVGEACNYLSMKKDMLESLASGVSADRFDFDLSWLEFPDIDWSIFDF